MSQILGVTLCRFFLLNLRISGKAPGRQLLQRKHVSLSSNILDKMYYQTKIFRKQNEIQNVKDKIKLNLESNTIIGEEYKYSDNPDVFGAQYCLSDELDDKEDLKEEEYIKEISKGNKETVYYARLIKKCFQKNKVKEAIDILEVEMKKDRIKPDKFIFNLLISGCGRAGYTRKAFKLFYKMKQRDLEPSGSTYTSLFNACANAPSLPDGINKANRLREIMIEKSYEPNERNYNAMIKAYGRCGDLSTSFQIVDEMAEKGMTIETSTFNFLLQACASDKDFGFRHALVTWHKMHLRHVKPDIHSFNTILKCVKDCSIGDIETMNDALYNIINQSEKLKSKQQQNKLQLIENDVSLKDEYKKISTTSSSSLEMVSIKEKILPISKDEITRDLTPNLLSHIPTLGNLIKINEVQVAEDRLLLIGGFTGFLDEMKINKVTPSIETFTALLEVIPSTNAAEKKLISIIRKWGTESDIDFFNTLIKKRVMRMDYDGAKHVLNMLKTVKLNPDIFTYGILSLTCTTKDDAIELLNNIKEKGFRVNIQILGALLNQGCYYKDFDYITEIMNITLDIKVQLNEVFLRHLSRFNQQCARLVDIGHPEAKSLKFQNSYKIFKENLHKWYEKQGLSGLQLEEQIEKIKENPYKKFKEKTEEDRIENIYKKKIRKHITKIKLNDISGEEPKDRESVNLL